jgi:hypothetical protein
MAPRGEALLGQYPLSMVAGTNTVAFDEDSLGFFGSSQSGELSSQWMVDWQEGLLAMKARRIAKGRIIVGPHSKALKVHRRECASAGWGSSSIWG